LADTKKLGCELDEPDNLTPGAIDERRRVRQRNARADENNRRAAALANSMRVSGQTWTTIVNALNRPEFRAGRSGDFRHVQRVMAPFTE